MKVGRIEIMPVIDGLLVSKQASTKPIPDQGTPIWHDQGGMFRSDGMKESTLGGFLIRTSDRLLLVDAGAGPDLATAFAPPAIDPGDPDNRLLDFFRNRGVTEDRIPQLMADLGRIELQQGELAASLHTLGVAAEDVTDVVLTHLHFDHIGWMSVEGTAYFPNATVRCAAADLDYFLAGPSEEWFTSQVFGAPSVSDRLDPVLGRIDTWETDSTLFPGIDVRLTPGHTPGSSVVVVSSGTERAMLLGDMVHCPLELQDDDFNFLGDHDQELANRVREAYAKELEGTGIAAAAAHFPGLRFGRILPSEGVRRWSFDKN